MFVSVRITGTLVKNAMLGIRSALDTDVCCERRNRSYSDTRQAGDTQAACDKKGRHRMEGGKATVLANLVGQAQHRPSIDQLPSRISAGGEMERRLAVLQTHGVRA